MAAEVTSLRLALAEDVPGLRMLVVRLLEQLGHTVVCAASNGEELVERCRAQQVDIVLTDLDMPVMDGLTAAQELATQGLPVILISGHPDADHVVLEHEPLAARVAKPVSLQNLHNAIEQVIALTNTAAQSAEK